MTDLDADPAGPITAHLVDFVAALRRHGVAVGPGETVDAARVLAVLDLRDRERLRAGLASAVLRRGGHRPVFDALFDLYFPVSDQVSDVAPQTDPGEITEAPVIDDVAALRAELAASLADPTRFDGERVDAGVRDLAGRVLDRLGVAPSAGQLPGWSAHQAMDRLAPQTLLARVVAGLATPTEGPAVSDERVRREIRERIAAFRRLVAAEAVRRTAVVRGRDRVAASTVPRPPEHRDFLAANSADLAELRRTVAPLARRLGTRLAARRRRARRGTLDLRRTLRASLSTGGVPVRPVHRRPRPYRPELVVLCDVSGSVAGFSRFTLLLVAALTAQFGRIRVFAFVDRVAEVTHLVTGDVDPADALRRMFDETLVTSSGHSDYGAVFRAFAAEHADVVGPRTALLVLGDARTNHGAAEAGQLAAIVGRARHAHWLNPERRADWGTGDSAAPRYAEVLPMHECRTAAQLADVVAGLLPV